MAGLSAIALGTAPILGGALLAGAAGQLRGPDYRSGINQDLDLLERLPADQVAPPGQRSCARLSSASTTWCPPPRIAAN